MKFTEHQGVERERFVTLWNKRSESLPELVLDESWPSAGVLDLLTMPISGKTDLQPGDRALVRCSALYIAGIIGTAWEILGVEVSCHTETSGIVLRGKIGAGEVWVELESEVARFLQERGTMFPVYSTSVRHGGTPQGWFGAFAIGCCTGMSPAIRGAWEGNTPESFKEPIEKVLNHLALTTVSHYERIFPDDLTGQVGELYLHGGIIPPLGIGEAFPAVNGSAELFKQLRALRIGKKRILAFAENLTASPDEHLSSIGLVLSCALLEEPPSPRLIALSERFGRFAGLLRSAVANVRTIAGVYGDWIREEHISAARVELEKQLGLLPWLQMPGDFLARTWSEKRLRRICEALSYYDYDTAADLCDVLIADEPRQFELRLQRIYLSILNKKIEEADLGLRTLLSEPECEAEPRLYALWGIVNLSIGDQEEAVRQFSVAYSAATIDHAQRGSITNDYGWVLLQSGRAEESLALFAEAKRTGSSLLTASLNELAALKALNRMDEYKRVLGECCKLSPLDRRVFSARFLGQT